MSSQAQYDYSSKASSSNGSHTSSPSSPSDPYHLQEYYYSYGGNIEIEDDDIMFEGESLVHNAERKEQERGRPRSRGGRSSHGK